MGFRVVWGFCGMGSRVERVFVAVLPPNPIGRCKCHAHSYKLLKLQLKPKLGCTLRAPKLSTIISEMVPLWDYKGIEKCLKNLTSLMAHMVLQNSKQILSDSSLTKAKRRSRRDLRHVGRIGP